MWQSKEQEKEYLKRYYQQNKEKIKKLSKIRYEAHKKEINKRHKEYRKSEQGRRVLFAKKFKCSLEEADNWLKIKDCEICGDNFAVATDHDHKTGKIRGRLCFRCNRAMGAFRDSPIVLQKAVDYLLAKENTNV